MYVIVNKIRKVPFKSGAGIGNKKNQEARMQEAGLGGNGEKEAAWVQALSSSQMDSFFIIIYANICIYSKQVYTFTTLQDGGCDKQPDEPPRGPCPSR